MAAHQGEKAWIEDVGLQCRERPVPGFHTLVGGSVEVDCVVKDGDVRRIDNGLSLEIMHTPGHSRGSISLWCPSEKVLISGDAVPLSDAIPIYEDAEQSVQSVRKLAAIEGVEVLLSSWNDARRSPDVRPLMARSLAYLRRIRETVLRCVNRDSAPDPLDLCRRVLLELGLPETAANPLVARTFMAHVKCPTEIIRQSWSGRQTFRGRL